jgi:hypothetical protein
VMLVATLAAKLFTLMAACTCLKFRLQLTVFYRKRVKM